MSSRTAPDSRLLGFGGRAFGIGGRGVTPAAVHHEGTKDTKDTKENNKNKLLFFVRFVSFVPSW
jgi:hypothetical protein